MAKWESELESLLRDMELEGLSGSRMNTVTRFMTALGETAGGRSFLELTRAELRDWLLDLKEKMSPNSMSLVYSTVKSCMKRLNGDENPEQFRGLKNPGRHEPRVKSSDELLSSAEIRSMAGGMKMPWKVITLVQAYTGARPMEVLRLERGDIKFNGNHVVLMLRKTKTGKPREAHLIDAEAIEVLGSWMDYAPKEGYVFPYSTRKRLRALYISRFKRAARRAGIRKNVYPYILRHSRATELRKLGVPDHVIKAEMGWEPGSPILDRVYSRLDASDRLSWMLKSGSVAES